MLDSRGLTDARNWYAGSSLVITRILTLATQHVTAQRENDCMNQTNVSFCSTQTNLPSCLYNIYDSKRQHREVMDGTFPRNDCTQDDLRVLAINVNLLTSRLLRSSNFIFSRLQSTYIIVLYHTALE